MAQPPMFYQRSPDYESNMRMAEALMAQGASTAPVASPLAALARVVQGGVGGFMRDREQRRDRDRQKEYSTALAQALQAGDPWRNPDTSAMPSMNAMERDVTMGGGHGRRYLAPGEVAEGTGGQRAMIAALMGNELTAPLGTQMQMQDLQNRQELDRQLALERAKTMFTAPAQRQRFDVDVGPNKVTYIGDPTDQSTWQKVAEAPRFAPRDDPPTTNVNVTTGGEDSYLKESGKSDAARRDAIFLAGDSANERLGVARQMVDLLVNGNRIDDKAIATGSLQPIITGIQGIAADLGLDLTAVAKRAGVNLGSLSGKQEFQRLSNTLARELSGELKGNLSDRDVVFLRESLAGLGRDEMSNALALASLEIASARAVERADLLREREERDGVSLSTQRAFEREWNQYIRENSIVDQVKARAEEIAAQRRAAVPEAPPRVVGAGNPPPFSQGSQTPYADMSTDDLMRRAFGGR